MVALRKNLYDGRAAGAYYSEAVIFTVGLSFLFSIFLQAAGLADAAQSRPDWYRYCSFLLPQIAFFLAAVVFFTRTQVTVKEVFRPAKPRYFFLAALLQFGLFSLSFVNGWFIQFLQKFLSYEGGVSLPSTDGALVLPVVLVVAVLPAVMEETAFRGIMLTPLKKYSTAFAVLVSGLLFSLYHQSPAQTIYQFLCGCAFALVAIRADSILPTILSHFLNNAFIVIFYAVTGSDTFPEGVGTIVFYILSALALAGTLVFLIFFDKKTNTKKTDSPKPFLFAAAAGFAFCLVMWIAALMMSV